MAVDTIIGAFNGGGVISGDVFLRGNLVIQNGNSLAWDAGTGLGDVFLERDAANILAQRNGTAAQTYRLYETYIDASNNQGLSIDAGVTAANTITITPFENGTGSDNIALVLNSLGTGDLGFNTDSARINFLNSGTQVGRLDLGSSIVSADMLIWRGGDNNSLGRTSAIQTFFVVSPTFAPASGTPTDRAFSILPTMNWGGTPGAGSYEALFIDVTETAIPTGTNYILRGQVDTKDIFRVSSRGAVSLGNFDEGGIAAWTPKSSHDLVTLTGATTDTTTISVPSGARLLAVLLNVNTTVVNDGDDTWKADFVTGSTTEVAAAGTAAAQNTKITLMLPDEITTGIAQIRFTPQGANFTAGVIEVVVYYEELTAMANA